MIDVTVKVGSFSFHSVRKSLAVGYKEMMQTINNISKKMNTEFYIDHEHCGQDGLIYYFKDDKNHSLSFQFNDRE